MLAYCITSNHMHLLVRAQDSESVSSWMQSAEGEFAQWHNRRKERTGAFWEGRYHCALIDGAKHLERCMTYIELNMVRAGVVTHPREWPWCSYGEWIARGWLTREGLWTEGVAVGDAGFVESVSSGIGWRQQFQSEETTPGIWSLREDLQGVAYGQKTGPKNACE